MSAMLIQIAGISDREEAALLVAAGADRLGFPLGPGVRQPDLTEAEAAGIVRELPGSVKAVLITYLDKATQIVRACRALDVQYVQLHGPVRRRELLALRALAPGLQITKSLIVRDGNIAELEAQLAQLAPFVDEFITDSYDPSTGACGATGRTHDWSVSRRLTRLSPRPIILAGGLNPENVRDAIVSVRPAGVDVHTGVERPDGRKTTELVRRFVAEARAAI